jgi:hypothetical protein
MLGVLIMREEGPCVHLVTVNYCKKGDDDYKLQLQAVDTKAIPEYYMKVILFKLLEIMVIILICPYWMVPIDFFFIMGILTWAKSHWI